MDVALDTPRMTQAAFFKWADAQEERYEFDGFQPVPMTGGLIRHSQICQNIYGALRPRLRGGPCHLLGPDAGLATIGDAVRYPDALVTRVPPPGSAHVVPGVEVVFEVLSPTSGRADRIEKLLEYRAVPSIRRYVILEYKSSGLSVFARTEAGHDWTATALTGGVLLLPEIGIEVPVAEFYEGVNFPTET